MADWKDKLAAAGKKIFGGGAAGDAATEIKSRASKIDAAVDESTGDSDKRAGKDSGEIGKKWGETFQK